MYGLEDPKLGPSPREEERWTDIELAPHLSEEQQQQAAKLIEEYRDLF